MTDSVESDMAAVVALSDLIDQWWDKADQRTFHHDGVEYVASLHLARFLIANGAAVNPPKRATA